jgi:hypothetical protein
MGYKQIISILFRDSLNKCYEEIQGTMSVGIRPGIWYLPRISIGSVRK